MITTTTAEAIGRSARSASFWGSVRTTLRYVKARLLTRSCVSRIEADSRPRLKMFTVPDEIVERQRWYERVQASDLEDEYSVICLN